MLRHSSLGITLACVALLRSGSGASDEVGSADLLVLCVPPFPSQLASGASWSATVHGPESVFGNPALVEKGISAGGGLWMLGTTSGALSAGFSLLPGTIQGVGVRYLGRGGLEGMDEEGNPTGEFSYSTGAVTLACGACLMGNLRAGVAATMAWENIGSDGGTGLAVSAGLASRPVDVVEVGLSLTNLGQSPEWQGIHKDMPVEISLGAVARALSCLRVSAAGIMGLSTADRFGAGLRLEVRDFRIDAGYQLSPDRPDAGGVHAGLSYDFQDVSGVYSVRFAVSQKGDAMDWPFLAGLSMSF